MENMHDVGFFNTSNCGGDDDKVDEEIEVLQEEPQKKRQRKGKAKQVKVEDNDSKRNWLDSEVETLIALKGEMQLEFIKNAKKQGVDMWLKIHSRLLCLQPTLKKSPKACKNKFNDVYKAYKDDKLANNISGESRHMCKFYDSMDTWYHQNGSVLKHVSATSSDMPYGDGDEEEVKVENLDATPPSTSKLAKSGGKIKYQESALEIMGQLVVSSKNMAESMKEATGFMGNLDKHLERLIDKL